MSSYTSAPTAAPTRGPDLSSLPLRHSTSIQGNVLAAFNKDHQAFMLLGLPTDKDSARSWLAEIEPLIASTVEVEDFNEQFSARRRNSGGDPPMRAVWVGLGLTSAGLATLASSDAAIEQVRELLPEMTLKRAEELGDVAASGPDRWLFGAPAQTPVDAIVTVAADRDEDLAVKVAQITAIGARHGVLEVFRQEARTLAGTRAGHEHFGFKDGISQPGVKGFHAPDPGAPDERKDHPGEDLVMPGEFVLGWPRESGDPVSVPEWLRDSSCQVFRRLAQDVPGWWGQVAGARPDGDMAAADRLGAKLVGRWRSGTPLANAPLSDRRSARSKSSDNDFNYDNDPDGIKTPRFAHIRKVYPRGPQTEERFGSEQHRIMRRGIPYGLQFDPAGGRGHGVDAERGLVFNMFCARIENQFEFLQRTWANNPDFPETGDGRDPVIGTTPDGSAAPVTLKEQGQPDEVLNLRRFVATRGSLYALAVSRPGLKALASGKV